MKITTFISAINENVQVEIFEILQTKEHLMGKFSVTRQGADILVNANPEDVFRVLAANGTWKTEREFLNSSETLSFVVFGRLLKDNGVEAHVDILPHLDGSIVRVIGDRGSKMRSIGGNTFNVGVKKFQTKILDSFEQELRNA